MRLAQHGVGHAICGASAQAAALGVFPEARTKDRFALVLLKNEGMLFGDTYFLERRHDNDDVYPGRFGLYGGMIESDETALECAVRELREETGIRVGQNDLVKLFDFRGENDTGAANEGEVFVYVFRGRHRTSASKIRNHQTRNAEEIKKTDDEPGIPVAIRPWLWKLRFWREWPELTPQAAYALLADIDREHRVHRPVQ